MIQNSRATQGLQEKSLSHTCHPVIYLFILFTGGPNIIDVQEYFI